MNARELKRWGITKAEYDAITARFDAEMAERKTFELNPVGVEVPAETSDTFELNPL
jgi:hypothetical protein